jgi:hypothetical protein
MFTITVTILALSIVSILISIKFFTAASYLRALKAKMRALVNSLFDVIYKKVLGTTFMAILVVNLLGNIPILMVPTLYYRITFTTALLI